MQGPYKITCSTSGKESDKQWEKKVNMK
jgi:hypothetical protein